MSGELSADILLILLICLVIYVILRLVNRGKQKEKEAPLETDTPPAEEKPE